MHFEISFFKNHALMTNFEREATKPAGASSMNFFLRLISIIIADKQHTVFLLNTTYCFSLGVRMVYSSSLYIHGKREYVLHFKNFQSLILGIITVKESTCNKRLMSNIVQQFLAIKIFEQSYEYNADCFETVIIPRW